MTMTRTLKHSKATLAFAAAGTLLAAAQASAGVTYVNQARTASAAFQGAAGPTALLSNTVSAPDFLPFGATAITYSDLQFPNSGPAASHTSALNPESVVVRLVANFRAVTPEFGSGSTTASASLTTRFSLSATTNFAFDGLWTASPINMAPIPGNPWGAGVNPSRSTGTWSLTQVGGPVIFSQSFSWMDDPKWWGFSGGVGGSKAFNTFGTLTTGSYDLVLTTSGNGIWGGTGFGFLGAGNNSLQATLTIPTPGLATLASLGLLAATRRRR